MVSTNYIYISFPPGEYSKNVPLATFEELKLNNLTIIKQSHFFEIIQGSPVSPLRILNREYGNVSFYFVPLGFFDTKLNLEIFKIV